MSPSDQVDEREDQDPDEIHEVPVEPEDLDRVVVGLGELALGAEHGHDREIDDPARDVQAVEARQREEGGPEEMSRVLRPFPEQMGPFDGLTAEEGDSAQ